MGGRGRRDIASTTARKFSHEMWAESSTTPWCLCCRNKPGRLKCSLVCRTVILRASSTSYKLFSFTSRGQERYLCKQELPGQQLGVHTDNFQRWKFSLALKNNSSIRDRILSLWLFTQNPAMNYFAGKALKKAMPGSLSFFWQTSLRKCPEEKGIALPSSVLCLSYLDTDSLLSWTLMLLEICGLFPA